MASTKKTPHPMDPTLVRQVSRIILAKAYGNNGAYEVLLLDTVAVLTNTARSSSATIRLLGAAMEPLLAKRIVSLTVEETGSFPQRLYKLTPGALHDLEVGFDRLLDGPSFST
jgi:hypothetical protein